LLTECHKTQLYSGWWLAHRGGEARVKGVYSKLFVKPLAILPHMPLQDQAQGQPAATKYINDSTLSPLYYKTDTVFDDGCILQ
jgi:hypothetical protein